MEGSQPPGRSGICHFDLLCVRLPVKEVSPALAENTLYILGSSGYAKELFAYAEGYGRVLFVDDSFDQAVSLAAYRESHQEGDLTLLGSGLCANRRKMLADMVGLAATLVHPSAVNMAASTGAGTVLAPGAVVAPLAKLSEHVLVNYLASVGHETVIGKLSVVCPNVSIGGCCVIEDEVFIGAGANIRQGLRIGKGATIGMGAVVTKDVPPGVTAMGVPAEW